MYLKRMAVLALLCTIAFWGIDDMKNQRVFASDIRMDGIETQSEAATQGNYVTKWIENTDAVERIEHLTKLLMKEKELKEENSIILPNAAINTDHDYAGRVDFPIVGAVGDPLTIALSNCPEKCNVLLYGNIGLESVKLVPIRIVGLSIWSQSNKYCWTPDIPGIFYLVVRDEDGTIISNATRKIYINAKDSSSYTQLGQVSFVGTNDSARIKAELYAAPIQSIFGKTSWYSLNWPTVRLSIGEDMIWNRTVKVQYARAYQGNAADHCYYFNEGECGFKLVSGNYRYSVSARGIFSVEDEDTKVIYQDAKRDYPITVKATADGNIVKAVATLTDMDPADTVVIACLYYDDTGSHVFSNYKEYKVDPVTRKVTTSYSFPTVAWNRKVEIRVKHSENNRMRSYEANDFVTLPGNQTCVMNPDHLNVSMQRTSYNKQLLYEKTPVFDHTTANVNDKNYIYVTFSPVSDEKGADGNWQSLNEQLKSGESYHYTAWVVDDGNYISLQCATEMVSGENCFVYIPLSGGSLITTYDQNETHKLIVSCIKKHENGTIVGKCSRSFVIYLQNE